jgi:hypothetical protein
MVEPDAGEFGERARLIDGAGDNVAEIDFLRIVEAGAALDGGKFEQSADEPLAAGGLGADVLKETLPCFDGHLLVEQFGGSADGGERALHFVGERLDVALDVFAVFKRIAHGIERVRECVDLAADADFRLRRTFAALDRAGVVGDFSDGMEQPEEHRADEEQDAAADQAAGGVDDPPPLADERHDIELRLVNR